MPKPRRKRTGNCPGSATTAPPLIVHSEWTDRREPSNAPLQARYPDPLVRRGKALLLTGRESRPATVAPDGSNRTGSGS